MNSLLESWKDIRKDSGEREIILFLDYDGTLTPIAKTPDRAVLSQENKELLERLAGMPRHQVVIVSGRRLSDVKEMVGIENIIYIGNHGWEVAGSSMQFENLIPLEFYSTMQSIKNELDKHLSEIPGAFVEDKGITMSVHYRLARDKGFLVRRIVERICLPYKRKGSIKFLEGKKVYEIRPPVDWDKGKAVQWIIKRQEILKGNVHVLPIYIGDDSTDEDAFKVLKNKGITVLVGKSKFSSADYTLTGPHQVTEFLKNMVGGNYERL